MQRNGRVFCARSDGRKPRPLAQILFIPDSTAIAPATLAALPCISLARSLDSSCCIRPFYFTSCTPLWPEEPCERIVHIARGATERKTVNAVGTRLGAKIRPDRRWLPCQHVKLHGGLVRVSIGLVAIRESRIACAEWPTEPGRLIFSIRKLRATRSRLDCESGANGKISRKARRRCGCRSRSEPCRSGSKVELRRMASHASQSSTQFVSTFSTPPRCRSDDAIRDSRIAPLDARQLATGDL